MKIILWTFGILLALGGLILFLAPTTEEAARNSSPTVGDIPASSIENSDIDLTSKPPLYIGDENAPVTLVEYGDFKCPSCNSFRHNAGAQIREEYVDKGLVKIEFRNYPFIGPDSGRAARGAYCANDQQEFAAYHDMVYDYIWDNYYVGGNYAAEYDDVLTQDILEGIMDGVVSDNDAFRSCMENTEFDTSIDTDIGLAAGSGISGTPGFTVNERKISGPTNFNTFKTLFDIELR